MIDNHISIEMPVCYIINAHKFAAFILDPLLVFCRIVIIIEHNNLLRLRPLWSLQRKRMQRAYLGNFPLLVFIGIRGKECAVKIILQHISQSEGTDEMTVPYLG